MSKTLSFACIHFTVAFLVGYVMTGSVWVGGALALIEPACNTVAFHLHEKVWKRIELRRAEQARAERADPERAGQTATAMRPGLSA